MLGIPSSILKYNVTRFNGTLGTYCSHGNILNYDRLDATSWSLWYRSVYTANNQHIIAKEDRVPNNGYWIDLLTTGEFAAGIGGITPPPAGPGRIRTHTDFAGGNDGNWHHVVHTYDGSGLASGVNWYIDSVSASYTVDQNDSTGSIIVPNVFNVGSREQTDLWAYGDIQDLANFSGVLTASEVLELYRLKGPACPGDVRKVTLSSATLELYVIFGEHKGDTGLDAGITSGTTVPDLSGNGYDGTLVNGPTTVTRL